MATNIPPHNLNEICDALIMLIDSPDSGVDELMQAVHGPDFPTRGRIFGEENIRQAYASGRGKVTMRGVLHHEETATGRLQIIIDELPYQVNKATLIQRIADLVRAKRIEGISDLRDESDRDGMRVVIELGRAGSPATVENQLFRLTALQSTFAVNMLALVDGQPRTVSLREALAAFIDHRREVIRRRSEFDLEKARDRAHILEGLLKALEDLDAVIAAIRASESADAAKTALMAEPFELSDRQAQAVLDMQLRRLAALERQRIEDEHAELVEQIAYLEDLLANPEKIDALIKEDCEDLKEKYGDERRTQVFAPPVEDISDEDLVPHQQVVVTISDRGYMKRVPLETYRLQGRGGRGVTGAPTREEDAVNHLVVCDTHASLLFFTQRGRVYSLKGYEVPEATRQARGIPVVNLIEIEDGDQVTAMVVVTDFSRDSMVVATANGEVKRTPLSQFESVRRAGLIAMNLKGGDHLVAARAAGDDDEAILVSSGGRAIRFRVGTLRVASRASGGVRGMRMPDGVVLIGLVVDTDGEDLLVVSELGVGKRTPIAGYPTKGRGGQGVLTFRVTDRSGPLAVARAIRANQEVILISREGIVMRTRADAISQQGRGTQGVAVMNIEAGDSLAAIAQIELEAGARAAAPTAAEAEAEPAE
jgi:DNA gyrase subunit A